MNYRNRKPKKCSLDELTFNALSQMQVLNYHPRSIRRYQTVWRKLVSFAQQSGYKGKLREQLIVDFLAHHEINPEATTDHYKGWKKHATYALTLLWHYSRFGYFERSNQHFSKLTIPESMKASLHGFKRYCEQERYLNPTTVAERLPQVGQFLSFLGKRDVKGFHQIRPEDLSDYVYSLARYRKKTIACMVSNVRVYLRYLFYTGKIKRDLSGSLPGVYQPQRATIPSTWDTELLEQLLLNIDRHSPRGKRDYAILLLACRLGLRSGDIRTLTLDHIDWAAEAITFTQAKTGLSLSLPLTDEIGNALISYIRCARPQTSYREVFLRLRPPIKPFSQNSHLHHIVKYWRELAGITFKTPQRQGLHSLRHSLATRMLEDEVPFSLIANILGHVSMGSTMIYAKASIESLRQVALPIQEVSHVNQA
jgi:integrase